MGSRLTRVVAKIFGTAAGVDQIAQFGSLFAGTPTFTTDPAIAQALSNWDTGWLAAAIGGNAPAIEDMNSVLFVLAYQIAYLMQSGVPEWNTTTEYFQGQLAANAAGKVYLSLTNNNQGNVLTDQTKWRIVGGNIIDTLGDMIYGGTGGDQTKLTGNINTIKAILTQTGSGAASAAPSWQLYRPTVVQKYISGSGTYTVPTDVVPTYIEFEMVGAGGGGGGSGNGSAGGNTTIGSTLLVAAGGAGGAGGATGGAPSAGGAPTVNSPAIEILAMSGGDGCGSGFGASFDAGGQGGSSAFGGSGGGGNGNGSGSAAKTNSGSGGGGAGTRNASIGGAGGAAGAIIRAMIMQADLALTYAYSVGAGGGGASGAGNGADGQIIIREYYI